MLFPIKIMFSNFKEDFSEGWADVLAAIKKHYQITTLGWQDVATRYRRSRVGAFWLTLNTSVLISALGLIFGGLFNQPMAEFLPYLSIGIIIWSFLTSSINEACTGLISAEGIILQVKMPLFTHLGRIIWRNMIILGHNLLILPFVFLFFFKPVTSAALIIIPGFILVMLNLTWVMLILALACARFRDLTQIIQNALQIFFYLTPIIWKQSQLSERAGNIILEWNPFYYLIQVIREPLLGQLPTLTNWIVLTLMALIGWAIALTFFGHYRKRLAFWL